MCVICVKARGVKFPSKEYLSNCFENNSDGAGFMFVKDGSVVIRKGFGTFDKFYSALDRARADVGDKAPFVMHFRIATQGFDLSMTHPFPLSDDINKLRYRKCKCPIGVAHNGIISLTSDGAKDYSDTMKFITDYLSGIIRNFSWRKDKRIRNTIEALIKGSRLALLDKYGNTDVLGDGWVQEDDVLYSNSSYKNSYRKYKYSPTYNLGYRGYSWDFPTAKPYSGVVNKGANATKEPENPWEEFKVQDGQYDFTHLNCPYTVEDDDSYCAECKNLRRCVYWEGLLDGDALGDSDCAEEAEEY